ncbi:myeloid differentiation primary response protein MyD88 isoform X2 [Anabrus simplex]|uniref:myeloid differentiation primary response protein MyD88 isoform X2 n=1 Tax=Anabrus simplex TaxID=316456 RepID=UPI0035A353F6
MAVADPGVNLYEVPVKSLQEPTKHLLATMLNPPKVIPTEDNLPRDWRGLAVLTGLSQDSVLAAAWSADPTEKVLSMWEEGTLGLLQDYLGQLDRWDVFDDTVQMMDDMLRLDQGLEPQRYHAYLLYADEDEEFALKIVSEMETKYKLKLCLRDRDLVGGHMFEHEAIMKLISERCDRLIVIITPNFLKSEANRFLVTFAHALAIDQRRRMVIPVMYERCTLPLDLNYYFPLDYSRSGKMWNFWDKLYDSIQVPRPARNGYPSIHQSLSESDVESVKASVEKEIVSAPIEIMTGSCNNIPEGILSPNSRSTSNPSLSKKSVSGSVDSFRKKIAKFWKDFLPETSNRRERRKLGSAVSEC